MTAVAAPPGAELERFARFCEDLVLEDGSRMVLEPFQRTILGDYFAGTRETLCLIPKKNGKTSLIAAVALHHLFEVDDAECVIGASSAKQASILYDQAKGLIRRTEKLRQHFKVQVGYKVIRSTFDDGTISVLAADAGTGDGVIPSLAIVDELHRHRNADLYGVFRDGLGARDGRIITLSTAGDDELSALGIMRSRAHKLKHVERSGAYFYARSDDGEFVMHEWALDPDQDRSDLQLVKQANPLKGKRIETLASLAASPSMTPWQWARFHCGVWVKGEGSAIDPADWDALERPTAVIPPGSPVYVGWDLAWRGHRGDTMALVPLWMASAGRRVVGEPIILTPPAGGMLDDRDVLKAFLDLKSRFQIIAVVYDPNAGGQAFAQQLHREHGLVMAEHSQRDAPMALADGRLLEAIRRHELEHNGDPTMRQHVLNAVEKPVPGDQFRFIRPRNGPRRPIDCLTALSMAHSSALADLEAPPARSGEWFML
jgi:phage terminase large subunit-like protein